MTTAVPSAALATIQPVFTDAERVALAGFLAGYRGLTREACALDLRQFTTWCRARSLALFAVRRADIESFARDLEARGRARATVTRRLSTIAGFCKYAVEEELLGTSPAAHVRRPRVDYESHAAALDRNELGALLVAAGLGTPGVAVRWPADPAAARSLVRPSVFTAPAAFPPPLDFPSATLTRLGAGTRAGGRHRRPLKLPLAGPLSGTVRRIVSYVPHMRSTHTSRMWPETG